MSDLFEILAGIATLAAGVVLMVGIVAANPWMIAGGALVLIALLPRHFA